MKSRTWKFKMGFWFIGLGWVPDAESREDRLSRAVMESIKDRSNVADGKITSENIVLAAMEKLKRPEMRSVEICKSRSGKKLFHIKGVRYAGKKGKTTR